MKATKGPVFAGGPLIRAYDPWLPGNPPPGKPHQLFNDEERVWLATIASVARFKKGEAIYSAGEPAKFLFNIISGVVKVYLVAPKTRESIVSFLYAQDLFGLAEEDKYTNSAKTLTPLTAYARPTAAMAGRYDSALAITMLFLFFIRLMQ